MKKIYRPITLLAAISMLAGCSEQTKSEPPGPEPLVINTVERQDDIVLTVIRDNGDTVFQYEGDFDVWIGADGKTYAMLCLEEEVLQ